MKKYLIVFIFTLAFISSGCVINIKTNTGYDGGIFISKDNGDNWQQITSIYRTDDYEKNFNNENATVMAMDPTDSKALYLGTESNGFYYTYNGGSGWQQALAGLGRVNDIAVSPADRCDIYVALDNKIYKSTDCNRHFSYQLIEAREDPKNDITALAIDGKNANLIYAGTSGHGLFLSKDSGFSWQVLKFFNDQIAKILVNPNNSQIIYVATLSNGIFKTSNGGGDWRPIINQRMIEEKSNILAYRQLILDPTVPDGILYASQHGLLRSADGGSSFNDIKLLAPASTTFIYAIAINPDNGQEIYYGGKNAFYRTVDGGENWITRKLPSGRSAAFLLVEPDKEGGIYLGVKK